MDSISIPSVNVDSDPSSISDAMKSVGFLFIEKPPVPSPAAVQSLFEISQDFFLSESEEEKSKAAITIGNVGWAKVRQEKLDPEGHPAGDLKEAFNMRPFVDGKAQQTLPSRIAAHEAEISVFMKSCHELCMRILEAFAVTLDLPKDFFTSKHSFEKPQGTILRLLYYPETAVAPHVDGDIRAGAHSDYGSITLLFQKDVGGLQILLPNGQWLDAPVVNDSVLVNAGNLMEFWTGGRFKSTLHRVALPRSHEEAGQRFSIAYFLHPDDDVLISRLTSQEDITDEATIRKIQARYNVDPSASPLTAGEWLLRRLNASYTGRKEEPK